MCVCVCVFLNSNQRRRRRWWHPTPVLLPGKSHGRRSLVGCSPWGHYESDRTQWLHFHFSLSCIGEGNGTPLQYSCLENHTDGGAWWAAVHGVAKSRTRLSNFTFPLRYIAQEWDCWIIRKCYFLVFWGKSILENALSNGCSAPIVELSPQKAHNMCLLK